MSEEMVVIGGPHDGQRIAANFSNLRYLWLPVYPPPCFVATEASVASPDGEVTTIEEYERQDFGDRTGRVAAWVHGSVKSPMRELLSGYRRALKSVKP